MQEHPAGTGTLPSLSPCLMVLTLCCPSHFRKSKKSCSPYPYFDISSETFSFFDVSMNLHFTVVFLPISNPYFTSFTFFLSNCVTYTSIFFSLFISACFLHGNCCLFSFIWSMIPNILLEFFNRLLNESL